MTPAELGRFACFADLGDEEREGVAALLREVVLDPGETLFVEGDEANGLFLVSSGRLRLARRMPPCRGTVGEGAVLGALSLVAAGPREATAVAEGACRVLWLPRSAFRRLVEDAPRAACRLLESVVSDLAVQLRSVVPGMLSSAVDPVEHAQ